MPQKLNFILHTKFCYFYKSVSLFLLGCGGRTYLCSMTMWPDDTSLPLSFFLTSRLLHSCQRLVAVVVVIAVTLTLEELSSHQ